MGEYESALREIAVYEVRLASLRLSLTRQAELNEVKKLTGAANTAGWVQQVTWMGRREARRPLMSMTWTRPANTCTR